MMRTHSLSYWAVIEHAKTWPKDAEYLARTRANGGKLLVEDVKKIAGDYRVARSFRGVAARGYGEIASIINAVGVADGQGIKERLSLAKEATINIAQLGYTSNPSAVSKWLWFRAPSNWYIYDTQAAEAVGAAQSSVSGMHGFYAILHACGVQAVHDRIAAVLSSAKATLRPERVIDKFLWLKGNPLTAEKAVATMRSHPIVRNDALLALAAEIEAILPDDQFDFAKAH